MNGRKHYPGGGDNVINGTHGYVTIRMVAGLDLQVFPCLRQRNEIKITWTKTDTKVQSEHERRVYRKNDQTWSFRFCRNTDNQAKRGSSGDAEGSAVSVTVPPVSLKWMKNRNRCHTTERCF